MYLKFSVNFARALAAHFLAAACTHTYASLIFSSLRGPRLRYMFNIGCFSNFSGARLSHFSRRGVHTAVCESFFLAAARESGAHFQGWSLLGLTKVKSVSAPGLPGTCCMVIYEFTLVSKRMHRPTTSRDRLHTIHTRFPGPTCARHAIAALSPRTDATPSLLAATSTAKS